MLKIPNRNIENNNAMAINTKTVCIPAPAVGVAPNASATQMAIAFTEYTVYAASETIMHPANATIGPIILFFFIFSRSITFIFYPHILGNDYDLTVV